MRKLLRLCDLCVLLRLKCFFQVDPSFPAEEFNDAFILAETSVAEVPLLVTSDKHLLDIDEDALLLLFNEADLLPACAAHSRRLMRALG